MTTALDTISGALRLLKVLAAGETAKGEDVATGLMVLNEMLEEWSLQELAIFAKVDQTFALVPGTSVYTVGPTGAWVGFRPIGIDTVRVLYQGIVFPVNCFDTARFNAIAYPAQTGVLPLQYNYDPFAVNGSVSLWPVPTTAMPIILSTDQQLTQIATAQTTLNLPPGYAKALRFCLARDLADEYETALSPDAMKIAASAFGHIKRANSTPIAADFDPALTDGGGTGSYKANFLSGV